VQYATGYSNSSEDFDICECGRCPRLNFIIRFAPIASQIQEVWFGKSSFALNLSQGVPFRVLHLNDPAWLIVDFKEADWTGVSAADILAADGRITAARFGSFQAGWSRMVLDLSEPMLRIEIGMPVDLVTGQADLRIALGPVTEEEFAANAGLPSSANWAPEQARTPTVKKIDDEFIVMTDLGHGRIDLGAVREGGMKRT
jgi:N-acetylmuramoyl-L-alanine amidase